MSENPEGPPPLRSMELVKVPDAPPPPKAALLEGPRDLTPISWGGTYDEEDDFRPTILPSEAPDPKGSSVAASADSSDQLDDLIPTPTDAGLVPPSQSPDLAPIASAVRVSTPVNPPVPSKPTS